MRLSESPGTLKRLRRSDWQFQRTFETPLKELPRFVAALFSALPATRAASAVVEQVVFDPQYDLVSLYERYALPPKWYGDDLIIEAEGTAEVSELLAAMLDEWIDFFLVPSPRQVVIYADHDNYITFLSQRRGHLSRVVDALRSAGFREVEYVRQF